MEDLLTLWDLECLIPSFAEHHINMENILQLGDDLLKELIPIVGLRLQFKNKLEQYKNSNDNITVVNESGSDDSNLDLVFIPTVNKHVAFCGIQNAFSEDDKMPDFDLATLLSVAPYGSLILQYYRDHEILNDYMRNKLVDIIIRNLYSYIMKYNLSHQQYNILTSKIINCFPNECHGKFYNSRKHLGHGVQAKGKLVDKVKNLRYKSPDKRYIRKRKNSGSGSNENKNKKNKVYTTAETDLITWLKFNREPWEDVLNNWQLTYNLRRGFECGSVSEYIKEWPIITDPRAESLIELDFSTLFPGKELNLLTKWSDYINKVISLKKKDFNEKKDPILFQFICYLEDDNLPEDSRTAIQLLLLPRLIPPKGVVKKGKNHWKFSILEAVDALIVHCENPGDIDLVIQKQIEKASNRKVSVTVQPYLIVQGPTLTNIRHTYIVIDKIHFKCSSTLKAVDILFKIFHVLKIKYPCQAEHIWMLVQRGIFDITEEEHDKLFPYIEDILHIFK